MNLSGLLLAKVAPTYADRLRGQGAGICCQDILQAGKDSLNSYLATRCLQSSNELLIKRKEWDITGFWR